MVVQVYSLAEWNIDLSDEVRSYWTNQSIVTSNDTPVTIHDDNQQPSSIVDNDTLQQQQPAL